MAKLGILTVHGMGNALPDFDNELKSALLLRLAPSIGQRTKFQTVHYHGLSDENQKKTWERLNEKEKLRWEIARKFFMFAFADATVLHIRPDSTDSLYQQVNEEILGSINALRAQLDDDNDPVVIIAQSLGCQIISNYIWDAQRGKGIWAKVIPTNFQKLGTVRLMFTTGCNIPLFVAGLNKIEAISKPNPDFKWFNYYDKDDVLGYPLKPLSTGFETAYNQVVTEDIPIDAGKIPMNFTPFSHTGYWTDENFLKPVVDKIHQLFE